MSSAEMSRRAFQATNRTVRIVPDQAIGVHRQAVFLAGLPDPLRHRVQAQAEPAAEGQADVLGHRQGRDQAQVLEHHADSQGPRVGR